MTSYVQLAKSTNIFQIHAEAMGSFGHGTQHDGWALVGVGFLSLSPMSSSLLALVIPLWEAFQSAEHGAQLCILTWLSAIVSAMVLTLKQAAF